jgi:SulP family sulfate permease
MDTFDLHRSPCVPGQQQETFISEPLNTITKAFSSHGHIDTDLWRPIENYLEREILQEGSIVWNQNDTPDGLYIIESGILRATYKFADHTPSIEESMVPGTLAGEMSTLSDLPRNATVTVERDAVVWKLSTENLARLELEQPKLARAFVALILKSSWIAPVTRYHAELSLAAKVDHDILLSALASRQ